ncbi:MAG: GNAT family N-acetyltransferase [Dermatophilaceae bacterium]
MTPTRHTRLSPDHRAAPPPGTTARALTPDDLDATFAVYAADELADAGTVAVEPEDLAGEWARPSFDLATDSVGVFAGGGLVAAAEVSRGGTRAEGAVHPESRGRGIGSWLLGWCEARAAEQGAATVGQSVPVRSAAEGILRARGYRHGWTSRVLALPDDTDVPSRPLPDRYRFATADSPPRERAAHQVIDTAFRDWSDRGAGTFEDWAATTVRRPGSQPWQLRLVETEGTAVGAAFVTLDPRGTGYVQYLAVDRAHRGRGLAQALLADAFTRAREHGATRSELDTDTRTGALDLYLKVGMEVTQTWVHLVVELPRPAGDR